VIERIGANAAAGAVGVPYWVFWFMLVIIVVLAAIILTRDKGVRRAIKKIFLRIKKEIHGARIKAAISKEKGKLADLWEKLGEKLWERGLHIDSQDENLHEIKMELERLEHEEIHLSREIAVVQAEIEKTDRAFEQFKGERETAVTQQENLKNPGIEELNRLKKELSDIEKAAHEKVKLKSKVEKKLAAHKKKIEEIRLDSDLAKIEKKMKTEEIEKKMETLNREIRELTEELAPLYEKKGDPEKAAAEIEPKIARYDEKIHSLKEELKSGHKEYNRKNREQLKKKGNLLGKKNQVDRQKRIRFQRLGKLGYRKTNRVEDEAFTRLYSEIHRVEEGIRDLEGRLGVS
jgi:chromosome segregation ATPase